MDKAKFLGSSTLSTEECVQRVKRLRCVLTDVDGVLTDSSVYYSPEGEVLKRFNVRDGMGVELLRVAGIQTAIVTRESTPFARARAKKLGIVHVFDGVLDKSAAFDRIAKDVQCRPSELAYVGDDIIDLGIMARVHEAGVTACPSDAIDDVKAFVHYVSGVQGGYGAFRDVAEWLLGHR